MKIYIVSKDKRYAFLNELLLARGYDSQITDPSEVKSPDAVILSVREELSDGEMRALFENIDKSTLVFSGNRERIKEYFDGEVIDYSKNDDFLQKNAYLTAEAFVSLWHEKTRISPMGMKILVCGYGRIGKCLCQVFSSLGAKMYIYARREEVRKQAQRDGFIPATLDFVKDCDAVLNTVPSVIFSSSLISEIPKETHLFELASVCGFESADRVDFALGLPGKILPKSAASVIFDTIAPYLP